MVEKQEEKIYVGKTYRMIIEQTIGIGKVLDVVKEKYEVKELIGDTDKIILIEERSGKI